MQNVVINKPYEFIPPLESKVWPALIQLYLPRYLRRRYGIASAECRQVDRLKASIEAGHGILLTPNHARPCDPMVLGFLARRINRNLAAMASWHLFNQDWFTTFMIRRMGAFSVYREGLDRAAITAAINILTEARRPLIIFPEGAVSRHNDQLMALMEGTALIARSAAKRRAKQSPAGKVVVHPIAIRYFFRGDLEASLEPVLAEIESRLSWRRQRGQPLLDRIARIAEALLSLKEVEYLGHAQPGDRYDRVEALINHLLVPLEEEWSITERESSVIARVKRIRAAIVPKLLDGQLDERERQRRWRQLTDCYLAQQMSLYPEDYVHPEDNIPEHVLETVERFEEDLTDEVRVHDPLHVVIEVGQAIAVDPERKGKSPTDPVMDNIEAQLRSMLSALAAESARSSPAAS